MATSSIRVLAVDDTEPFRRFIVSTLQARPELQVIGEVSDGLEAVWKAQELHPDLILLDIGLPKLNGIEVAQRIRRLSPQSKIPFVSQESSADVCAKGFQLGRMRLRSEDVPKTATEKIPKNEFFGSSTGTPFGPLGNYLLNPFPRTQHLTGDRRIQTPAQDLLEAFLLFPASLGSLPTCHNCDPTVLPNLSVLSLPTVRRVDYFRVADHSSGIVGLAAMKKRG